MKVKVIREFGLYPKGNIQIGWKEYEGGLVAGVEPLYCKISIPEDCGLYPDLWFPLRSIKSQVKIIKSLEDSGGTIPRDILLDCYSYAWENLYRSSK